MHLVTSRAPLQPIIHQQLNIAVLVANDIVTPEGLATTVGIAATAVEMTVTGVLRAIQASPQITDATGRVTYSFVCDDFGASGISFALATGETVTVDPGLCVPEPTTTLAPPPTAVPQPQPVPSTIA